MDEILSLAITESPQFDLLILIAAISVVGAAAAILVAFRRGEKPTSTPQSQEPRGYPIGGKIERLDRTVSEFRGETLRALELMRKELEAQHRALETVQRALNIEPSIPSAAPIATLPSASEEATTLRTEAPTEDQPSVSESSVQSSESLESNTTLAARLKSTRRGWLDKFRSVFSSKPKLDAEMVEELRALLISGDLGVRTVDTIIEQVKGQLERGQELDEQGFRNLVQGRIEEILLQNSPQKAGVVAERVSNQPKIVLVVGVNGVGKTTTVAKLAHQWSAQGARVLLVAADTFRAAAVAQLSEWATRLNLPVVVGAENAKPQTVVFDAMQRLEKEPFDIVIIDTAGRLQTKLNLMQELEGIRNAITRHQAGAPHETLLVVDGSTGQNAISQAREFNDATPLTGLIVTKLDGTPKGGVVVAIKHEFGIPVRYIGVGESPADLREFNASEFAQALFDSSMDASDGESKVLPIHSAHGEQRRRRRAAGQ